MSQPRLSALVVARNEEARLADCLASLTFADEIVVVLDRTTDRSAEIARGFAARVLEGAWEIEGERRNAGLAACLGEWILEIDADERVPPALAAEIRRVIETSPHAWHEIPVDNFIGSRLVRYGWGGSFGISAVPRLSRKGAKQWGMQRVHPSLQWRGSQGPRLQHALEHHVDRDISDLLHRLDRYSSARAADLLERGEIGTLGGNLRRFVSRFLKCYVSRGGWREGGWGGADRAVRRPLPASCPPEGAAGAGTAPPGRRAAGRTAAGRRPADQRIAHLSFAGLMTAQKTTAVAAQPGATAPFGRALASAERAFGWTAAALPLLLIYGRGFGDVYLSAVAIAFLAALAARRDATPLRAIHAWPGLIAWAWLVTTTALTGDFERLGVALAWGRVPVAVAALGSWVLASGRFRRPLLAACGIAAGWIALEVWLQALTGRSLSGFPRAIGGEHTGPFRRPRAGAYLVRIAWPPLAAASGRLVQRGPSGIGAASLLIALFMATIFVVGQRMPLVHATLGVVLLALGLRGLRVPALVGILAVVAIAMAAASAFPTAFARQVTQFVEIMASFPDSHYGQILRRALALAEASPWTGWGADAFRTFCSDPRFFVGWGGTGDGGGAAMCVPHAHNPYLDMLVNAGLPGLALFVLAAFGWLLSAGRGLILRPCPLRLGLFISVLLPLWPFGSMHAFTSQPTSTLWALMTGWAIAEATAARRTAPAQGHA